jgi:hypothetical protein
MAIYTKERIAIRMKAYRAAVAFLRSGAWADTPSEMRETEKAADALMQHAETWEAWAMAFHSEGAPHQSSGA